MLRANPENRKPEAERDDDRSYLLHLLIILQYVFDMSKVNPDWDGRPSFYPLSGYEMDERVHQEYLEFCDRESIPLFKEEESESEDESENEGDPDFLNSPPLYDGKAHRHEMSEIDNLYSCFRISNVAMRLLEELWSPQNVLKDKKWNTKIADDAMDLILQNRTETADIDNARNGIIIISARVKGLHNDAAPSRRIAVPGNMLLSAFHDRVLCPSFGWTRGYHDYRFAVPPSGYEHSPPKIPMCDIIFGAASKDSFSAISPTMASMERCATNETVQP